SCTGCRPPRPGRAQRGILNHPAALPRSLETEATMAALNHIIIPAEDKDASAKFLADILGVEPRPQWGPFRPVQTSNGVTLDFVDSKDVRTQHYAFLVDDKECDASFARLKKAGITY